MRLFIVDIPDRVIRPIIVVLMVPIGALAAIAFSSPRTVTSVFPLPHHIPKYEGGISLRFAMVHDVIHERYPKHGRDYYEERNRLARRALSEEDAGRRQGEAPTPAYFALKDDLGVGLERLGKHEEAVSLMREKQRQQEAAGLKGRDLYSTQANLGTFLILWQMEEGFADLPATKRRLNEGLKLVRASMISNPEAHFGREVWQAVLLEFFLVAVDDPTLLTRYDMIGNRLDQEFGSTRLSCFDPKSLWGKAGKSRQVGRFLQTEHLNNSYGESAELLRMDMRKVGAEEDWACEVVSDHEKPVPFDEPTLGIVGMWRYGGGANPHFALALGEIMLRVGQRYIAWCAYERAANLGATFQLGSRDRDQCTAHCRKRQALIEEQLPANGATPCVRVLTRNLRSANGIKKRISNMRRNTSVKVQISTTRISTRRSTPNGVRSLRRSDRRISFTSRSR